MPYAAWILCGLAVVSGCKKKPRDAGGPGAAMLDAAGAGAAAAPVSVGDCRRPIVGEGTGWGTLGTGTSMGGGFGGTTQGGQNHPFQPHARVKLGKITADGDLDVEIIKRVLRRNQSRLSFCYRRARDKNPSLAGDSVLKFTVQPSGKVTAVDASGFDPKLDECLEAALKSFEYPKPTGGSVAVELTAAFEFIATAPDAGVAPVGAADPFAEATRAVRANSAELSTCYSAAIASTPETLTGTAVVAFGRGDVIGRVEVWGLGDATVEDCIAAALAPVGKDVLSAECELTLGAPAALRPTVRSDALVVEISASEVKAHGKNVLDVATLLEPSMSIQTTGQLAAGLGSALAGGKQLLIRATADAPAGAIEAIVMFADIGGYERVLLALGPDLLPGMLPARGVDGQSGIRTEVLVEKDALYFFGGHEKRQPAADVAALEKSLADLRTTKLAGRSDLAVAADPEVPFQRVAQVYRAAAAVGFTTIALLPRARLAVFTAK